MSQENRAVMKDIAKKKKLTDFYRQLRLGSLQPEILVSTLAHYTTLFFYKNQYFSAEARCLGDLSLYVLNFVLKLFFKQREYMV